MLLVVSHYLCGIHCKNYNYVFEFVKVCPKYCRSLFPGHSVVWSMVWLPDGAKILEDMFLHFDRIHKRDDGTDRRTDTT